jgi:hypothetical protein
VFRDASESDRTVGATDREIALAFPSVRECRLSSRGRPAPNPSPGPQAPGTHGVPRARERTALCPSVRECHLSDRPAGRTRWLLQADHIESGPTRCSARVLVNPASVSQPRQSAAVKRIRSAERVQQETRSCGINLRTQRPSRRCPVQSADLQRGSFGALERTGANARGRLPGRRSRVRERDARGNGCRPEAGRPARDVENHDRPLVPLQGSTRSGVSVPSDAEVDGVTRCCWSTT